jgi:DNA-binding transcriptional LysR family regulator
VPPTINGNWFSFYGRIKISNVNLSLEQLEAFYWIAQIGSFQGAADKLHVTQPTISLRIRSLERALGKKLFERGGREVRVSVSGAALIAHAEQMLSLARRIAGGEDPVEAFSMRLRLGAPDSFAMICLPALLRILERQQPALKVDVTVENSAVLDRQLHKRALDVAFLADPTPGSRVRTEFLGHQDLGWVASARLALPRRRLKPADLAHYHVFTNPEPSKLITLVRSWFSRAGIEPSRISTCNSLSVVARLTSSGSGISLLPLCVVAAELRAGTLRRLSTRPEIEPQTIYAAYQADVASPVLAAILANAREVVGQSEFIRR